MKLIHLSDLHLGKRVSEFSMLEDQRYILEEILRIIDGERPDAVLIAGDISDKPVPPAAAVCAAVNNALNSNIGMVPMDPPVILKALEGGK